jgi:subtilisin family serine protease
VIFRNRLLSVALALVTVVPLSLGQAVPAQADTIRGLEYWLSTYGFYDAWNVTRGGGVIVSVIDSGIGNVADLGDAVIGGADFSGIGSADGRTAVGASLDHGTLVASLLAGRGTGAGAGVIGTAPEASLLSASVALGVTTDISSDDQIAQAIRWSVDNGATVINMSLTRNSLEWPRSWDDAFSYAFDNDVVIVAAAGNRGTGTEEVGAPATIPGVLTVAGLDANGEASYDASSQGITIGVAAPGEELVGVSASGQYMTWSGSSGATPLVAGMVALVRASHPELNAANVIQRVLATATPVGSVPSPTYGYGIINAAAAVSADVAPVEANPLGDLAEWIHLYRRAESEPIASSEATATPTPLPLPDESSQFSGAPTVFTGTNVALPLAFLLGFGTLIGLGTIGVVRRVRSVDDVPETEDIEEETITPPVL